MNYNLLAYLFYLPIMAYVTVIVGRIFHRNGRFFIEELHANDLDFAHRINDLLLVGYYMVNLGYVIGSVSIWEKVEGWAELVETVSERSAWIFLVLAVMHYINMTVIYLAARRKIKKQNSKF